MTDNASDNGQTDNQTADTEALGIFYRSPNAQPGTSISGAEVPKQTMSMPIGKGGIPKWLAQWKLLRQSDPHSRPEAPIRQ